MPHTFPGIRHSALFVGRTPPSAVGPLAGLPRGKIPIPRTKSGSRGIRADEGVRPTVLVNLSTLGKV
jgi:hypothetical protein